MIELALIKAVFDAVGLLYWLFAVGVLIAVWKWGKGRLKRAIAMVAALALVGSLPVTEGIRNHKADQFRAEAFARFNKYCTEKAGEKIYTKVEGVESVFVMRPREPDKDSDYANQFWRGDPYGIGLTGSGEIVALMQKQSLKDTATPFQFVETSLKDTAGKEALKEFHFEKKDASINTHDYEMISKSIEKRRSRYGFTWEDLSTDDDRKYWIAGSLLKVVDLETNEIIAERIGYMIDSDFGSTSGGRSPWRLAVRNSCPQLVQGTNRLQTREFVIRSLSPSQKGE